MSIKASALRLLKELLRGAGLEVSRVSSPFLRLERLEWLRRHDIRTVIDIGANAGQFAALVRNALPDASIYSFEPIADVHAELVKNMRADAKFTAFPFGLGEQDEERAINRNEFTPSSSLLPMNSLHQETFPFAVASRKETVSVRRLDDLRDRMRLEPNVLIKIDVQGYEDRVIRGGLQTFREAAVVLMEVGIEPLYEGQWLFAEMHDALRDLGFDFKGIYGQLLAGDGAPLQADVIFVRDAGTRVPEQGSVRH